MGINPGFGPLKGKHQLHGFCRGHSIPCFSHQQVLVECFGWFPFKPGFQKGPASGRGSSLRCPVDFHGQKRIGVLLWRVEFPKSRNPCPEKKRKKGPNPLHWATEFKCPLRAHPFLAELRNRTPFPQKERKPKPNPRVQTPLGGRIFKGTPATPKPKVENNRPNPLNKQSSNAPFAGILFC